MRTEQKEPERKPSVDVPTAEPRPQTKRRDLKLVDRTSVRTGLERPDHETGNPEKAETIDWSVLMACAQNGDGKAYARLLTEVTPYLRSLAAGRLHNAAEIEDAVQDVLLTIHRLRDSYDPRRPFGPWLVTIARRRIIDKFRQSARWSARETALMPSHETFSAVDSNRQDESSDRHVLRKAIDDLPPSQREAIRLLKLQEMSLKEASAASGMSISALKVAAHRAVKSLKRTFADWNGGS